MARQCEELLRQHRRLEGHGAGARPHELGCVWQALHRLGCLVWRAEWWHSGKGCPDADVCQRVLLEVGKKAAAHNAKLRKDPVQA